MKIRSFALLLLGTWAATSGAVTAQTLETPLLRGASFDGSGRLGVAVRNPGPAGCYLSVNGGLTPTSVTVPIVARQVTAGEVAEGIVRIRTVRRYYCARRTLYVRIEKSCLGEIVGTRFSKIRSVSVPERNLRR